MKNFRSNFTLRAAGVFCCLMVTGSGAAFGDSALPSNGAVVVQSGSGSSLSSDEADSNHDGQGGADGWFVSNGFLGDARSNTRSDLLPWDGHSFCNFKGGSAQGVVLTYSAISNIDIAANGDQLFSVMSSSPPSTVCFNFVDNQTLTFEAHYDVVGGTGRFKGASGTSVSTGSGTMFVPGHTSVVFRQKLSFN